MTNKIKHSKILNTYKFLEWLEDVIMYYVDTEISGNYDDTSGRRIFVKSVNSKPVSLRRDYYIMDGTFEGEYLEYAMRKSRYLHDNS